MDDLVRYRINSAREKLESSQILLDAEEQYQHASEMLKMICEYLENLEQKK